MACSDRGVLSRIFCAPILRLARCCVPRRRSSIGVHGGSYAANHKLPGRPASLPAHATRSEDDIELLLAALLELGGDEARSTLSLTPICPVASPASLKTSVSAATSTRAASAAHAASSGASTASAIAARSFTDHPVARAIAAAAAADYVLGATVGTGAFSRVRVAEHRPTGDRVAVKMVDGRALRTTPRLQETVLREVALLRRLAPHRNVVGFREATLIGDALCIVTEYVAGCELFEYVAARGRLSEEEAAALLRQVVRAIVHLHASGIAHRDLKLENVLVAPDGRVVLIDLGLAHDTLSADLLTTRCGSEEYAAPEVILGRPYDGPCADAWSFGVLLYGCLAGTLPFNPDAYRPRLLCESIVAVRYVPPEDRGLSPAACALVRALLVREPSARMRMEDVLGDVFFAACASDARTVSSLRSWSIVDAECA